MKKTISIFVAFALLLMPITVHAATPRIISIQPGISFDGTTANCSVVVFAEQNDQIGITMRLWQGSRCIATWYGNGTTYLVFNRSIEVTKGKEYKLTVDAVIANVVKPQVYCIGTC